MAAKIDRPLRGGIALVTLALAQGCMFGYGKPYPGAALRHREGAQYKSIGGGWYEYAGIWSEDGGGGKVGFLGGVRGGAGTMTIGDTESTGFDAEFGGEVTYAPINAFSFGLAVAHEYSYGKLRSPAPGQDGAEVAWGRWATIAMVEFVPVRPFVLRAGIGRQFGGSAGANDMNVDVGGGLITTVGVGMAVPFTGLHFVPTLDYRRSSGGDVDFGEGTRGAMHSNAWIASLWTVF